MQGNIRMSALGKTWVLDLDGTILKHNGYKLDGRDSFLPGAEEFLGSLPEEDMVVFVTSRAESEKESTEAFLEGHGIRYAAVIYNAPYGERILINDSKPSGLRMAYAIPAERDVWCGIKIQIDQAL